MSSTRYRVALQGFSAFERQALESYFRLAATPKLAFDSVGVLADSDFCVVDADRVSAVEAVRSAGRMDWGVFVGAQLPKGAIMHLARPIDPTQVARALETLVSARQSVADPYASVPAPVPDGKRARAAPVANFDIDVLVVDDTDIARRFLQVQLGKLGCRVTEAASGEQALAELARHRFRVVFTDVDMKGLDGLSLCQQIKLRRKGAPTVVLMSAKASASDRVRATLAGGDAFLPKPIDAEELLSVLRTVSNRRRRAR